MWGNGSFSGDYRAFHSAIVRRMPMDQVPNFYTVGTVSASFQAQRPFTLTAPAASVPANPGGWGQGTGSTGSPRRTLRHGDSGEDVRYLQQRLSAFGYWLSADGQFGPATESTVRSFQRSQGWWPTASWVRRPGPPSADPRSLRRPSREAAAPSIPAP
ncbi:hypothetical protein TESS_TESS_01949 [Tessaracoccus sp. O5.2]|uniref:peptidoglycan-binding domain-containing protein n=1 Tax=Tessaracoccus sp. O5.2 TaxID=3157622 RepID=UPI0035EFE81C